MITKKSKIPYKWIILTITIIILTIRLYITFQHQTLKPEAYFHIDIIQKTAKQLIIPSYDNLSYGGREIIISPFYYYTKALILKITNKTFTIKILPQIIISLIIPLTYIITKEITNKEAAFFSSLITSITPLIFSNTLLTNKPLNLSIILTFLALYTYSKIPEKHYTLYFLITTTILSLTTPLTILLILTLISYHIILRLEKIEISQEKLESTVFSSFIFIWINFLIYKDAFLKHGLNTLTQNTPQSIITSLLNEITRTTLFLEFGLIPIIGGITGIYYNIFKKEKEQINLYIALTLFTILLTSISLIKPNTGLTYLAITLAILSAPAYQQTKKFLSKSIADNQKILPILTLLIITIFMVTPTIQQIQKTQTETIQKPTYQTLKWIKNETPQNTTITTTLEEGHLISTIAKRKNIADNNFLMTEDPEERIKDIETIYTTPLQTRAIETLSKYNTKYIILTSETKEKYNITKLKYENLGCINQINQTSTKIYKNNCKLE